VFVQWADLLRDLDRLQEATIEKDGKSITTRTAVAGQVGPARSIISQTPPFAATCSARSSP
jgi:hypothetical protein